MPQKRSHHNAEEIFSRYQDSYLDKLDSEKDIEIATDRLVKDNGWSKLRALSALHSKYLSERRKEEAVIVNRLIDREKSRAKAQRDTGFHDDM